MEPPSARWPEDSELDALTRAVLAASGKGNVETFQADRDLDPHEYRGEALEELGDVLGASSEYAVAASVVAADPRPWRREHRQHLLDRLDRLAPAVEKALGEAWAEVS